MGFDKFMALFLKLYPIPDISNTFQKKSSASFLYRINLSAFGLEK